MCASLLTNYIGAKANKEFCQTRSRITADYSVKNKTKRKNDHEPKRHPQGRHSRPDVANSFCFRLELERKLFARAERNIEITKIVKVMY